MSTAPAASSRASSAPPAVRRRGLALIETALVLPLLFLVLLGMIEYSWLFWKNQQINNAARHGARLAVVEGATNAEVTAAIDQLMAEADLDASGYTIAFLPNDVASAAPGDDVSVSVTVVYANIEILGAPVLPLPANIGGTTTMVKEGPR